MRRASITALLAIAACTGESPRPSDTSDADAIPVPASADSQPRSASDTQPPLKAKTSGTAGTSSRSRTTGTTGAQIDTNAPLHPADTFGLHPRDTALAEFLKKRPPEVRRPQDPRTPR